MMIRTPAKEPILAFKSSQELQTYMSVADLSRAISA
jgi:hypothetical protein